MIYLVHLDPKGWIPQWVVDYVAPEQAKNVLLVKKNIDFIRKTVRRKKAAQRLGIFNSEKL